MGMRRIFVHLNTITSVVTFAADVFYGILIPYNCPMTNMVIASYYV